MKRRKLNVKADLNLLFAVLDALCDPSNVDLLKELCVRSGLEGLVEACDEELEDK